MDTCEVPVAPGRLSTVAEWFVVVACSLKASITFTPVDVGNLIASAIRPMIQDMFACAPQRTVIDIAALIKFPVPIAPLSTDVHDPAVVEHAVRLCAALLADRLQSLLLIYPEAADGRQILDHINAAGFLRPPLPWIVPPHSPAEDK